MSRHEFITAVYRGRGEIVLNYRGGQPVHLPARVVRSILMELRVRAPELLDLPPGDWHLSDDDSEAEADAAERASWMLPPHFPGD